MASSLNKSKPYNSYHFVWLGGFNDMDIFILPLLAFQRLQNHIGPLGSLKHKQFMIDPILPNNFRESILTYLTLIFHEIVRGDSLMFLVSCHKFRLDPSFEAINVYNRTRTLAIARRNKEIAFRLLNLVSANLAAPHEIVRDLTDLKFSTLFFPGGKRLLFSLELSDQVFHLAESNHIADN